MESSKYHLELWSPDGQLVADLAGRAKNRRIVQCRNEAEEVTWQLDLDEFERYASLINVDPNQLIVPGRTEVRIKRDGKYICGGQISYRNIRITPQSQDIEIRAQGFLNLLKDRYTDELRVFTATQATTIASTLITESQATGDDWDFGITIGSLATVGTHDKTFKAVQLKEAIQRCAELLDFDFEFTHDKVFNTYERLGSNRPNIIFEYPRNILSIPSSPLDATSLKNHVTVLGSGSGTEDGGANVKVVRQDGGSQAVYKVRQSRETYSEVEDTDDLSDHGDAELAAWAEPFEVPVLEVDGNMPPYVTDYGVGDHVRVLCKRYKMLEAINGMFRIEKRIINIDEDDKETVTLYLAL